VILVWRSASVIERCLGSLSDPAALVDEVVVVDNASADGSVNRALAISPGATIVPQSHNLGVAAGRQAGVAKATQELILFLDDDAELMPGTLAALQSFLVANPNAAVVAPRMVDRAGNGIPSARGFPTIAGKLGSIMPLSLLARAAQRERFKYAKAVKPTPVDYVIGACQLIRRSALESIGGLDTDFFYGPEDVDMCLRLWKNGWQTWLMPSATFVHPPRRSARSLRHALASARHAAALIRYFAKHRYVSAPVYADEWGSPRSFKAHPMSTNGSGDATDHT
jgi:GT2 family glycosyltransferase